MDANHDASVVIGYAEQNGITRAFRWTESEGMMHLGFLRPSDFNARAMAVFRAPFSGPPKMGCVNWRDCGTIP